MATTALTMPDFRAVPAARDGAVRAEAWPAFDTPAFIAFWDRLARQSAEPNPFLESWYLLPALRSLDPRGSARLLVCESDGELTGLLPISFHPRYYRYPLPHLTGWRHANAFVGTPLIAAGREEAFWSALLAWADANAGAALFLHLADLPLDGPVARALETVGDRQGRGAMLVHREERAMLASRLDPGAYCAAALTGKKRKELRRQHARLTELGAVTFERQRDESGLEAWTDAFLRLEASGWKGGAGSSMGSVPATAALFRAALAGAAARGKLERLALVLDGRPIAMLATFLTPPGAFSYKTAFDERFARFSPGVLLQRENLELLSDPAVEWCDSCAAANHPMIDHVWRERRAIGRVSIGIGGPVRRALFQTIARAETRRNANPPKADR